jgi:hypothetical protein
VVEKKSGKFIMKADDKESILHEVAEAEIIGRVVSIVNPGIFDRSAGLLRRIISHLWGKKAGNLGT